MFDNGSTPPKEKQSRGLLLEPDTSGAHGQRSCRQFTNPSRTLLAESQGNTLSLPGGDWLMGYGGLPNFTEYDSSGHVLLDGTLGKNVQDFRTYLSPWSGAPATGAVRSLARPNGAGRDRASRAAGTARPSVASWRVLAGASATALAPVATRAASRALRRRSRRAPPVRTCRCRRSTARGNVLGTSATVKG